MTTDGEQYVSVEMSVELWSYVVEALNLIRRYAVAIGAVNDRAKCVGVVKQPTLAVDFDGVLHDHKNPVPGRRMGLPLEGAVVSMWALQRRGYRLVVFTCNNVSPVADWLDYYKVAYDEVTNTKPIAEVYIDDRGLRHTSWDETMLALGRLERGL